MSSLTIPEEVRKDAEEVKQWEAERAKSRQADVQNITADPDEQPVEQPPQSQPSELPPDNGAQGNDPQQPKTDETQPQKKAPTENATEHDEKSIDYYKQRTDTVIGLNKQQASELKALKEENRNLSDMVASFEERLKNIETTGNKNSQPGTPKDDDDSVSEIYSPEFVTEYGEDLLKGVAKGQKKVIEKMFKQYDEKIKNLESKVVKTENVTSEQAFWGRVERVCPSATDLNSNPTPEYLEWLDQKPQGVPYTRRKMGEDAIKSGDFSYVGELMNQFLGNRKTVAPQGQPVRKTSDIVPNLSGSSPASAGQAQKPIYTEAMVDKFYEDKKNGVYDGKTAERDKIEKQIESAYREGRVR